MEASVRIFHSPALNRRVSASILNLRRQAVRNPSQTAKFQLCCQLSQPSNFRNPRSFNPIRSSLSNSYPFGSITSSHSRNFSIPTDQNADVFSWNKAGPGESGGRTESFGNDKRVSTVVLLGWLGARTKHLKRYAELYNARGINVITFVVPVSDVLWFDLGRKVENRISILANELALWLSGTEDDGRERCLLFHTFSNTGWLVYGSILDNWRNKQELVAKIKGCVVDSGGDPELNPRVWAAGFAAALLKKSSSSAYPSAEAAETDKLDGKGGISKMQAKEHPAIETVLLGVLEWLFSLLLKLPDVNQKLTRIISTLSGNKPPCLHLYLYSTADKVIPFRSVESFIEDQRRIGRNVWSFNFGLSPHVDHYRTFPDMYSSLLHNFLKECLPTTVKQP